MSDDVLSIIPADPYWQPDRDAAERAAALAAELAPGIPDGLDVEIEVTWYESLTAVDCGANLTKIGCPLCGTSIDTGWWAELLDVHYEDGLPTLAIQVPCCGGQTALDALDYDWPCGFARFEIAIWNPDRGWFNDEELAALANALGRPVRQIIAHI
ncbi:hypothetical protein [Acrocarpospora macrocephala]|nr:hypothetical protein [Acrocarpospora macrocephala]